MAILSAREIRRRLGLRVTSPRNLVITPLLDQGAFSADAVDLRLGTQFLLPQVPPNLFVTFDPGTIQAAHLRVYVPFGKYLVVPAHQTVLGATLEFIKLPADVSGLILTKSSIARTFVVIETAPWIHPAYRGCLTLEIANVSNTPLLLYPGIAIGQLVLQTIAKPVLERRDRPTGSYIGPVYPEPPTFETLPTTLGAIGVTDAVEYPMIKQLPVTRA